MLAVPPDLTVAALNGASGDQLRFWIQGANDAAGTKVLNKSGKVEDLRARLAVHYGLDRAAPTKSVMPTGPVPLDKTIQARQWAHLRDLGHEWAQTAGHGHEFKLCVPSKDSEYSVTVLMN